MADFPEALLKDWEVRINFESTVEEALLLWGAPRSLPSRLGHLKAAGGRQYLFNTVDSRGGQVEFRADGAEAPVIPFKDGNNVLMMSFAEVDDESILPKEQVYRLDFEVRRKDTSDPWIPMDSVLLTLQRSDQLYEMWSTRVGDPAGEFRFPLECHPQIDCEFGGGTPPQIIPIYPEAQEVEETGDREAAKTPTFVYVHGYYVDEADAKASAATVAKRLYWRGFRGNVIAFAWEGDELAPAFAPNVENAFQTAPRFREFLRQKVQQEWGVPSESIYVMAHSLGNQVVADALRIDAMTPGAVGNLFNSFTSVEPAIWKEAFWPQEEVSYSLSGIPDAWVYSVDDLRTNSWAFWYTNEQHPIRSKISHWIHGYSSLDWALLGMVLDDYTVRNPLMH
ncbi:MAG: alpha/beta hydrolase, partial [Acidobacteriota bacterium]